MLNGDAIALTEMYLSSLGEYFGSVPDHRLPATIMNPLLATCGFKDFTVLFKEEGVTLVTRVTQLLRRFMQKLWKKKLAGKRHGGASEDVTSTERLSTAMTPLEQLWQSREEIRETKAPETDPIDDAVAEWLNQDFSRQGASETASPYG